jgi:hypothetical protein
MIGKEIHMTFFMTGQAKGNLLIQETVIEMTGWQVFHPYHIFRWAFKNLRRIRPLENENIDCVETNTEGMS